MKVEAVPFGLRCLVGCAIVLAFVLIGLYFFNFNAALSNDQGVWGEFGDFIGGILNPLFSIIALFALLHTIKLQSFELNKSTEQLERSAEALTSQNVYNARQQFDSNFFQLMSRYDRCVDNLRLKISSAATENLMYMGVEVLSRESAILRHYLRDALGRQGVDLAVAVREGFNAWMNENIYVTSSFYRSVEVVFQYIESFGIDEEVKSFAYSAFVAQLSYAEVVLICHGASLDPKLGWLASPILKNQIHHAFDADPLHLDFSVSLLRQAQGEHGN